VQSSTLHSLSAEKFEERFWEIVKAGFAHKRKKLSGNLKNVISYQGSPLIYLGNKRAEDLSLIDWILLAK
jgi:16S rRNA A1518/A1519 N6-dimethyltransferase RsmA/KsgA/DIM1 with predicted DNA glycosylase/AP lyase activity